MSDVHTIITHKYRIDKKWYCILQQSFIDIQVIISLLLTFAELVNSTINTKVNTTNDMHGQIYIW